MRDYPLNDGTMVRQYDISDNTNYTIYQYHWNGEKEELHHLAACRFLMDQDSDEPCPYYEIDGKEVKKEGFDAWVSVMIDAKRPLKIKWTAVK